MTRVITVSNYKGGVGKSTFTEILSYILATQYNNKVLVVDLDPQADVSEKLKRTFSKEDVKPKESTLTSMMNNSLEDSIVTLHKNLDLLHGSWEMEQFEEFIFTTQPKQARYYFIDNVLEPIKNDYDFIIFDTRPSTGVSTNNAICTSDYVIITTKTEQSSAQSSKKLYSYIGSLIPYNNKLKLIGVLPYLDNPRGSTSSKIKEELYSEFGLDLYTNIIKSSDRVVTWGKYGLTEHKPHDKKTLKMYQDVTSETLDRIRELEE